MWRSAAALLATAVVAAAAALPPDLAGGRLESPTTTFPVQPDSIFAPVVAATPAIGVEATRRTREPAPGGGRRTFPLDGLWRFRLESTDCGADETQCEGVVQRWFDPAYDDSAWRELAVPGHWMRQIPEAELGGRGSPTAFHFGWYRTRVTVPPDAAGGINRLQLVFEAVDYRADVWWDGTLLTTGGSHVGTFNPFAFDLPIDTAAGTHTLTVRVQKPLDPGVLSCGRNTGAATDLKRVIDGTKGYWDGRPGGNSDDFDVATKQWLHTGGIARPVSLVATGPVRLDWVFVTAEPKGRRSADVVLAYTITNRSQVDLIVELTTTFSGPGLPVRRGRPRAGVAATVVLHPGTNRAELRTRLRGVRPWFPAGHPELGGPAVYTAESTIVFDTPSDRRADRFGIRKLQHYSDRCEDRFAGVPTDPTCADDFGYVAPRTPQGTPPPKPLFQRFVNGRRIFVKGAAVDPNAWAAGIDRAFSDAYMARLRDLHANQIGLAVQIAPPVFYDAADDAGITVVQDFELQWTYNDVGFLFGCDATGNATPAGNDPPVADGVVDTAARLAADMVYLLYNHPAIVHWVAHNEPTWELAEVLGPALPIITVLQDVGRRLDRRVVDVITGIDATRPVKAAAGVGDSHQYSGYLLCSFYDLVGLDPSRTLCNAESTRPVALLTEFGSHVWPFSAKRWMPPDALFPADRAVRRATWSDADPRNPTALVPWLREWLFHTSTVSLLSAFIGSPADYDRFQDFALASQLYQRRFLQFYVEHYRKDRYRPTAGIRFFQFRDYWDQGYFGVYDQFDVPTAAVPAVRDAFAPLLVTSQVPKPVFAPGERLRFPIWIANDTHRKVRGTLEWRVTRVPTAYVLRGVVDLPEAPFQDVRRAFLNLPDGAPPQPVVTPVLRPDVLPLDGEPPLTSGTTRVRIDPDDGSPPGGSAIVELEAPAGAAIVAFYRIDLALRRGRRILATTAHLVTVADPSWDPPPGLSDGVVPYGTDPGDLPLAFDLVVRGAAPGVGIALDVPQFGGGMLRVAEATADADGRAVFPGLVPDEYLVRRAGETLAHVGLVEPTTVDLAAGSAH